MRARPGPRALVALAVVAGVVAAGVACGGGGRDDVLSRTARRLNDVRSGVLTMRLLVASGGGGTEPGQAVGFELAGPFSFDSIGPLPVAELTYTLLRGTERTTLGFTSTGYKAYVEADGAYYEIPEDRWDGLRLDPGDGHPGLAELRIDRWVVNGEVAEQGEIAGVRVQVVRGGLDVGVALADVLALARQLGVPAEGAPALIGEGDAVHLARALRSATAEVVAGRSDGLLRGLSFDVVLGAREDDPIRPALGAVGSTRVSLHLRIEDPNKQVTVAEPIGARPLAQLDAKR